MGLEKRKGKSNGVQSEDNKGRSRWGWWVEGQGQRVEDGDEEDLGLALRSSYSLAQSSAAAGLTHLSLTSRKKSESEPFSSPDLSPGHKAGKAHKSCKFG